MNYEIARPVKAKRYGSEGLAPVDKHSCPYRGAASCVSASGGSYCGGYGGDLPIKGTPMYSVRCLEENNTDFIPHGWVGLARRVTHPVWRSR
ncbi:MAG: hypothetical protein WAT67_02555 [Candidatus Contendobacter sp.]